MRWGEGRRSGALDPLSRPADAAGEARSVLYLPFFALSIFSCDSKTKSEHGKLNNTVGIISDLSAARPPYLDHGLQLDGVGGELADPIGEFLHGHAVLVVLPAEILLIQVDLLQVAGLGCKNKPVKVEMCCGLIDYTFPLRTKTYELHICVELLTKS